jgi:hypothetical protein
MPNLFVVFKKAAENHIENFVDWCAGPMVHCDIVPGDTRVMFTSYMFERFSANKLDGYSNQTHHCLSLAVTQEEHDAAQNMLVRFVEKGIPYNYTDVFRLIMPFGPALQDYECEDQVQSLFCSQAIVMVLKATLSEENKARASVIQLNSRATTPTILYEALAPHCESAETLFHV